MAKLKALDVLNEIEDDEKTEASADPQHDPRNPSKEVAESPAKRAGESLVSPYQTDLRAKLRDKTQMNFGQMPKFIVRIFEQQAKKAKMNRREYFYHLLREQGGDIPAYKDMDGRKL